MESIVAAILMLSLSPLALTRDETPRTVGDTHRLRQALARARPGDVEPQPRLVVLTDISSLTAGVAEPDDGQSLIRLMLYSNDFDIEGLIATSNLGHGQKTRADLIHQ